MITLLTRLATFAGKYWLRVILIGCALVLLSQRQVKFNVRLGHPATEQVPEEVPRGEGEENSAPIVLSEERAVEKEGSFLDRFNIFGSNDEASLFDVLARQREEEVGSFLNRFSHVAQAEQEKFGVPASIVLATSLLYARAGNAAPARDLNNFFGLECTPDWSGATAQTAGKCLRNYENAWTSFRDFSLYITSDKFSPLTQFGPSDYRRWALGLEELGYNGTEDLAGQLQRTVDRYQLFQFD